MWPAERGRLGRLRRQLLSDLHGDILEIGAGTGANFAYYPSGARVLALEPDPAMLARARNRAASASAGITLERAGDERLAALPARSFDAVVFTLVLCMVREPLKTLAEVRRVLRPGGRLVVIEHVRSSGGLGKLQDRLRPLWERLAAGCQLNRETKALIAQAGFDVRTLREERIPGALVRDLIAGSVR